MTKDYEEIRRKVEQRHQHDAPQPLPATQLKKKSDTSQPLVRENDEDPVLNPGRSSTGNSDPKSVLPPNTLGL
jgi:hypothetical protein